MCLPHGDASPQNLLVPADAPDTFVVIDISFRAPHALGFDLGQLLVGLVHSSEVPAELMPAIADRIVPSYIAGLRRGGYRPAGRRDHHRVHDQHPAAERLRLVPLRPDGGPLAGVPGHVRRAGGALPLRRRPGPDHRRRLVSTASNLTFGRPPASTGHDRDPTTHVRSLARPGRRRRLGCDHRRARRVRRRPAPPAGDRHRSPRAPGAVPRHRRGVPEHDRHGPLSVRRRPVPLLRRPVPGADRTPQTGPLSATGADRPRLVAAARPGAATGRTRWTSGWSAVTPPVRTSRPRSCCGTERAIGTRCIAISTASWSSRCRS